MENANIDLGLNLLQLRGNERAGFLRLQRPNRIWDPINFLINGYRVLPSGAKQQWRKAVHTPQFSTEDKRGSMLPFPHKYT